jgi:hypothetical protein
MLDLKLFAFYLSFAFFLNEVINLRLNEHLGGELGGGYLPFNLNSLDR